MTSLAQEDDLGYNLSVPALTLGADGQFFIAYGDGLRVFLVEGRPDGYARSILARGKVSNTELEIAPDGRLSAVYSRTWDEDPQRSAAPPNQLFYAIRSDGVWSETDLIGVPDEYIGFQFGFAYDPQGFAHITHYVGTNSLGGQGSLHLVRQTVDGWDFQRVDTDGQPGLESAMAFGSDGAPHIVAEDNSDDRLKYYRLQQ